MSPCNVDLATLKIRGYTFRSITLLEGVDNVAIAYGTRSRDGQAVAAKLSYGTLRLEREHLIAKRLGKYPHANQYVCQPLEIQVLPSGLMALIFAIEGENRLDAFYPSFLTAGDNLLDMDTFLDFAIQCCECLEFLHSHQVVHGEIKLNAFLWPEHSTVQVWNFGSGLRSFEANLTSEGWRRAVHRYGAYSSWLPYMAPEQTGRTNYQPDHRTDLYSLGVVLHVVLTQSIPFANASPMDMVHSVLHKRIPAAHKVRPDVPICLSAMIEKLTRKTPGERYMSAHGLLHDLIKLKRAENRQSLGLFELGKHDKPPASLSAHQGARPRATSNAAKKSKAIEKLFTSLDIEDDSDAKTPAESASTDPDLDNKVLGKTLKSLPREAQRFLQWASFIGTQFSYETIRHLMVECCNDTLSDDIDGDYDKESDVVHGFQSALKQGVIQVVSGDTYRFTHDEYAHISMTLTEPDQRDMFHLKVASHFVNTPGVDAPWVADHLKAAAHLIKGYDKKAGFRAVLVDAGDAIQDSGAHKLIFSYFALAQELLSTDPWSDGVDSSYQETLHIHIRLAEVNWFMGNDATEQLLQSILRNARSAIDRTAANRLQQRSHFGRKEHKDMRSFLIEYLDELGVENVMLDLTNKELHDLYRHTLDKMEVVGLNKMIDLPLCESRLIHARMSLLEDICFAAYWTNDIEAILSVGAQIVNLTLKHGTVPSSGIGFVSLGVAAVQLYQDHVFGQQTGEIGVALCKKYGGCCESARARYVYGVLLNSWAYHYRDSVSMFRQASKEALLGGDWVTASLSHLHTVIGMLFCGEHTSDTLREAKICLDAVQSWNKASGASVMATLVIRTILALQGRTYLTEEAIFDDKEFKESEFVQCMTEQTTSDSLAMTWYYALKLMVLVLYQHDEAAVEIARQTKDFCTADSGYRHVQLMLFFECIAMFRLMRADKGNKAVLQSRIEAHREKLQCWADQSPVNFQMFILLVDAELSSFTSDMQNTQRLYDSAIDQAKSGQWSIETSISYEMAGEYYTRIGSINVGELLIGKAVESYRHQGCWGKADQLEKQHGLRDNHGTPTAVSVSVQTETHPTTTNNRDSVSDFDLAMYRDSDVSPPLQEATAEETLMTLDVVDLASILKSSQVISSEVNFELLLKQMLDIILENSVAESGVIIIKEHSSFLIMGAGSQADGSEILSTPKLLSEEADSVVTRVAHHALSSQESLLIPDIQQDSRFSDCSVHAKAVICTPITHKGTVVGCIYIEGAVGSLTSRHEVVLHLLSQQIGISVSNALLFKSIQKVTYANVKMIENQKSALEEARMSKEAALRAMKLKADFLANMSHELRTPFSGFYGMISLLLETSLDPEQLDIVHTAKESCEMLLRIIDDLLNFSKLEAGKVVLDMGPLVVEEVIADTIEMLSSLAARKGLELAYIVDPSVPRTVIGDSSRLRQILTNLLGNAIKFTHQGGVLIQCGLEEGSDDNRVKLKFEVIDTGIGIPVEQQDHLFEPFSQVDGSTTRMYGGTGLGLSICLQLVHLMMGNIGVHSQPNMGSNFWFSVVVDRVKKQAQSVNSPSSTAMLTKYSILLSTQHDHTASMIQSLLPELKVKRAADMQHAISEALQEQHDILLLDIPPIPNSYIEHQLQSVDDDPECDLHIVLLYTPATEGHKVAAEATNTATDRRGRLVKMAKPARRAKLLRALEQTVNHPRQSPALVAEARSSSAKNEPSSNDSSTTNSSRMRDYFDTGELTWFKTKRVLIAEDNMVAQKLLRKQLEKMGFIVESANNGEEAVELWQQRPPQYFCISFFDHHMPKCDGVEATKRIRELEAQTNADETDAPSRLPIIALTADIQTKARDICVNAGMDGYLTKPLIPKDLAAALREFCSPAIHSSPPSPRTPPLFDLPFSLAPTSSYS